MPDITMCNNRFCPRKNKCYRHVATPGEYQQAYFGFTDEEHERVFGENCGHYWEVTLVCLKLEQRNR